MNVPFPPQNNSANTQYNQQAQYVNAPSIPSPYSTTSSPGYHSPNISTKYTQNPPLKKYTLQPPPRKLPLSKTMPSLGFPGMFPQRPGQDEDILTESNVRHGFVDRPVVSVSRNDHVFGIISRVFNFLYSISYRTNIHALMILSTANYKMINVC